MAQDGTHAAEPATAIERLMRPRSVAVVGASPDFAKTAGRPLKYLLRHGFGGAIYPVNPNYDRVAGLPCYADIAALPAAPDAAVVVLGNERATAAVADLAARGTGAAVVVAGGYGEAGDDGRRRQAALAAAAGSTRLLGPNTIGLVNATDGIMLSASGALEVATVERGGVAVVSQSGGILGALLSRAAARGIGLSKLVATGNEADLDVADFVDYLADDAATRVIALYLEGVRHPDRFRAAVLRARAAGKPVVAFKVGRSEAGARSASSHTGAMAGADRVYDGWFRQLGIRRLASFAELIDVPAALAAPRRLAGRRIAVLTSTGGAGTLLADACGQAGLEMPPPAGETARRLHALMPAEPPPANPVDLTLAGLKPAVLDGAIGTLLGSPDHDAVVVVVGSSSLADPDLVARPLAAAAATSDKPLLAYVSPSAPAILAGLARSGVPSFETPEGLAAGLTALLAAGQAGPPRRPKPIAQLSLSVPCRTGPLDERESKALFAAAGIPAVLEAVATTPAEAAIAARAFDGPVVVKVLARGLAHKTEAGGVALHVHPAAVEREAAAMERRVAAAGAAVEGFLVQEAVTEGVEMILGFVRDPQLGPAILLGAGGIAAELFDDTAIRLPPLEHADATAMIDGLKARALLAGVRGRPRADHAALAAAVVAFSRLALTLGERLVEAEINPLFVLPEGRGVVTADGLVVLR